MRVSSFLVLGIIVSIFTSQNVRALSVESGAPHGDDSVSFSIFPYRIPDILSPYEIDGPSLCSKLAANLKEAIEERDAEKARKVDTAIRGFVDAARDYCSGFDIILIEYYKENGVRCTKTTTETSTIDPSKIERPDSTDTDSIARSLEKFCNNMIKSATASGYRITATLQPNICKTTTTIEHSCIPPTDDEMIELLYGVDFIFGANDLYRGNRQD